MRRQAAMMAVVAVMAALLCAVLPAAASPACGAHCKACEQHYSIDGAAAATRCAECEDGYLAAADGLCGKCLP